MSTIWALYIALCWSFGALFVCGGIRLGFFLSSLGDPKPFPVGLICIGILMILIAEFFGRH
ncbi:MAG: hypothetical protein WCF92_01260 [bacterium]